MMDNTIKRDWYIFSNGQCLVYPPLSPGDNEATRGYCTRYGLKVIKVIFNKTEKEMSDSKY